MSKDLGLGLTVIDWNLFPPVPLQNRKSKSWTTPHKPFCCIVHLPTRIYGKGSVVNQLIT